MWSLVIKRGCQEASRGFWKITALGQKKPATETVTMHQQSYPSVMFMPVCLVVVTLRAIASFFSVETFLTIRSASDTDRCGTSVVCFNHLHLLVKLMEQNMIDTSISVLCSWEFFFFLCFFVCCGQTQNSREMSETQTNGTYGGCSLLSVTH